MSTAPRSVLISGASIAGPTLAYWLHRFGFTVTVVEKAATVRLGGYPIDLRGNATQVTDRMGLTDALRAASIAHRTMHFVDKTGQNPITLSSAPTPGDAAIHDVELPRGALSGLLNALTQDKVEYRFNTAITSLTDGADGVDVTFSDGTSRRFDLVVGADGLHSATRKAVFGPESQFDRHIGFCFAAFDLPNTFGLQDEALAANAPGKLFALVATAKLSPVHVFFNVAHPPIPRAQADDPAFQRALFRREFADWGWLVPEMLDAMDRADDLFFDEVKQIRMPAYTKGRVALIGDAAAAPSFLTGQGSSLAVVGAYILACELALNPDHNAALAVYDRAFRPYAEANQALIGDGGTRLIPLTQAGIDARNAIFATITAPMASDALPEHAMLDLSRYLALHG